MTTESTLLNYERVAPESSDECIIWLHGLGADGFDFMPIVPELQRLHSTFIFPHAPTRPITCNGGFVMRAWYDIYELNRLAREDEAGLMTSRSQVHALIQSMEQEGFASEKIVLAGFSQGGAMTLLAGLSYERPLKAIVALSCYLPLHNKWPELISPANQDTSIFMAHGHHDEILPFALAKEHAARLKQMGCNITWHDYLMGHTVSAQEVINIREFLA